jgi:hypothetical protein
MGTRPRTEDEERRLSILELCVGLEGDELRVVESVCEGLTRGRATYGILDVESDSRDFVREAGEEVRDAIIYVTAALLRRSEPGGNSPDRTGDTGP